MPMNKLPKLREPRGPIVQQVRDLFLQRELPHNLDHFYLEDLKLVENMDFLLQRCVIMQRKDVEASVRMLAELLRWRKERRLYELSLRDFPQELTMAGGAFLYEEDKFGNRTLYLRASMCKSCAELRAPMRSFLEKLMFDLDDPVGGSSYAIIMDLTNATMANYDLELLQHVVGLLKDRFPVNLDYVLAVNFPWLLSAVWCLVRRLIPAEKRDVVQFVGSAKVSSYVERRRCPDFLAGACERPYRFADARAPTAVEYLADKWPDGSGGRRLGELLDQFSDALPADHIRRLRLQIELLQQRRPCKALGGGGGGANDTQAADSHHQKRESVAGGRLRPMEELSRTRAA